MISCMDNTAHDSYLSSFFKFRSSSVNDLSTHPLLPLVIMPAHTVIICQKYLKLFCWD